MRQPQFRGAAAEDATGPRQHASRHMCKARSRLQTRQPRRHARAPDSNTLSRRVESALVSKSAAKSVPVPPPAAPAARAAASTSGLVPPCPNCRKQQGRQHAQSAPITGHQQRTWKASATAKPEALTRTQPDFGCGAQRPAAASASSTARRMCVASAAAKGPAQRQQRRPGSTRCAPESEAQNVAQE